MGSREVPRCRRVEPVVKCGVVGAAMIIVATLGLGIAGAQGRVDGARPIGMGSAFTANASGNGALYHNPAGIATSLMYSVEGSYFMTPTSNAFNASVVDSKLNPQLAAGAAYSYELGTDNDIKGLTGHDARLVFASQLLPERMVVGLGGRYLHYTDEDESLFSGFTMDVGTVIRVTEGFFVGLSALNLIDVCADDKDEACPPTTAPRTLHGGLAFGSSLGFQVVADVEADVSEKDEVRMVYGGGTELLIAQLVVLRGGYRYLAADKTHVLAAGGGLKSQTVGLDIGFQQNLDIDESLFSVAIQLFM